MIEFVRSGVFVAASGIQGAAREQVKAALLYYRLETQSVAGRQQRVATPARMWSERPDGSIMFLAGYAPKIWGLLAALGCSPSSYTRLDRPEPLVHDLTNVDVHLFRPEQIKMLEALVAWDGGQIVSCTGSGKSWACAQICRLYPTAQMIFSAPTIDTVATLKRYLQENCGEEVGQVGGGKCHSRRVTVTTYDSVIKVAGIENCDVLIVDEVHRASSEGYAKLFGSIHSPRKRFGLTATPDGRSDKGEWMAEGLFGPVIVDIAYQESVASGSVVPLEIVVHANPYGPDPRLIDAQKHQADKDRAALWMNRDRNALIAQDVLAMMERLGGTQTLVLVEKTEHLLALKQFLPDFECAHGDVDAKKLARINKKSGMALTMEQITGDDDRDRIRKRFETGEAKRVLATSVFATGVSSNSCGLVALASGAGAPIAFIQSIGRGSRVEGGKEYAVCLMWEDTFHRSYHARAKKLMATAAKAGHSITKIPITAGVQTWMPKG